MIFFLLVVLPVLSSLLVWGLIKIEEAINEVE